MEFLVLVLIAISLGQIQVERYPFEGNARYVKKSDVAHTAGVAAVTPCTAERLEGLRPRLAQQDMHQHHHDHLQPQPATRLSQWHQSAGQPPSAQLS